LEHTSLHFHVNFHIDMCGVDIGVSQPVADHIDIVTCPQQMHGGGMADSVRGDGFGRKGWGSAFGCGGVFAKDVPHTEACDG